MISLNNLFILSSPSGAGKNTLINRVMTTLSFLEYSISTTTRTPREYEIHGKHYYFETIKTFQNMIQNNDFLEWEDVYGKYYGTSFSEIERIYKLNKAPILDLDVKGTLKVKAKYPEIHTIFIMPPSLNELKKRLQARNTESKDDLDKRLSIASQEIELKDKYDYIIINDNLEIATLELKKLILKLAKLV